MNTNIDVNDNLKLINIILYNPEEFESEEKPRCVHSKFLCTLNREKISIESARADDNGAYLRNGISKRNFAVSFENGRIISSRTS